MYMLNWTPLGSFGPQFGHKLMVLLTPTLEIDKNTKTTKLPHTTRQTYRRMDGWMEKSLDGQKYGWTNYTTTQSI